MTLKEEVKKFLANVPEEYVFWCCDGHVMKNMQELGDALNSMTEETFAYHANTEKNDFVKWVRDIIGDEKLAKNLEKAESRAQAAKQAAGRVATLTKRLA
jgi:hypothetical protein